MSNVIAAISTAMVPSGIGVIRLSGEDCAEVASRILKPVSGKPFGESPNRKMVLCDLYDRQNRVIDRILGVYTRGPHSYTGEDTVELQCHGSPAVLTEALSGLFLHGARQAGPGEFTKRAFLNGKLDLSQAEGVIDVINSETVPALSLSVNRLGGSISKKITEIRDELLAVISQINAAIDYPEEDVEELTNAEILSKLKAARLKAAALCETADSGRILTDGINTAIVGKPNVGKSSLLNALLGENRAIVTDIAGTTRDVISERLVLKNTVLNVFDTAGIHQTADCIESFGIDKSKECINKADLVLFVVDGSLPLTDEDAEIYSLIKNKKHIVILNKSDLACMEFDFCAPAVRMSAKYQKGIDELSEMIDKMFEIGKIKASNDGVIINMRHKEALISAERSISLAISAISANTPIDMASIDITNAISALGEISGQTVSDEIVHKIFASFCVGK